MFFSIRETQVYNSLILSIKNTTDSLSNLQLREGVMNFLIFINSLSCGGAERVTVNLANHWAEKDWHVTIVTLASCELDFYPLHPSIQRIALESDGHSDNILRALVNNLRNIMVLRTYYCGIGNLISAWL